MLEYPEAGGHMGFVTDEFPGRFNWLPSRLAQFFTTRCAEQSMSLHLVSAASALDTGR